MRTPRKARKRLYKAKGNSISIENELKAFEEIRHLTNFKIKCFGF